MSTRTRRTAGRIAAAAAGALSFLAMGVAAPLAAVGATAGDPTDTLDITPILVSGNPSCSTLNSDSYFSGITSNFGFKVNMAPDGTYPLDASMGGELTGGAPSDSTNRVQILNSDGVYFDWAASLGIDAVIVKASDAADVFVYLPEAFADSGLHGPVNAATGMPYDISHVEFCYDYELTASKTAAATYTRTFTWDIDKSVAPDAHSGFAGATFSSGYDVALSRHVADSDFAVSGDITVTNGTPFTTAFSVVDDVGGTVALVQCPVTELLPGASTTCTYSAALAAKADGTNVATVTSLNPYVSGATATAGYTFGEPTTVVGFGTVNVTDSVEGYLGAASDTFSFAYTNQFECSTDAADYTDGTYTYDVPNTATITETTQSDSENVTVTCYAPVVSKSAAGTYTETHEWTLLKSVNPLSQSGYPGDELGWTWTVDVGHKMTESDFAVAGAISVANPNPTEVLYVQVADMLNDGTVADVDCTPADIETSPDTLAVAAGSTGTCHYLAQPTDRTATLNTATVTLGDGTTFTGASFTATAGVAWAATVIDGSATLTDDQLGLDEPLTGADKFTGTGSHTCSTAGSAYEADGSYSGSASNTAVLALSGGDQLTSTATTQYLCEAALVDLIKYTDGFVDPDTSWTFRLYEGPDGHGTMPLGESSTAGDADGILDFGVPALRPDTTYTVCEIGVPTGWTSFWQVDTGAGYTTVIPYDPDADAVPPEDLGNRCVDFGVDTARLLTVGETVHFVVNNTHPGGDPRTPGYWKNWNSCTGGNQAETAAANGGWEEGFWLLEDVLAQPGGIVWDAYTADDPETAFAIMGCEDAVSILNAFDLDTGKNMNGDAGFTLAKHLLTTQLNLGAGACVPVDEVYNGMTVPELATAAESLLDDADFDGIGTTFAKKSAENALALNLAKILDNYNNGMYCGSTMP